jgi:hypothetical protein
MAQITVVNVIPQTHSDETNQDRTQHRRNPTNAQQILISASAARRDIRTARCSIPRTAAAPGT